MINKSQIELLPQTSGVYIFWQAKKPIYIGKSINILFRIRSHFQAQKYDPKEKAIFLSADQITTIATSSDFEAILLEAKLIREHLPRYNSIARDDKKRLYLHFTSDKEPRVLLLRKNKVDKQADFGPFASTHVLENIIFELRKIVPFCTQKPSIKRICFHSRLGQCRPCPNSIASTNDLDEKRAIHTQYLKNISVLKSILRGQGEKVKKNLEKQIRALAKDQKYEEANEIKTKLLRLQFLTSQQKFFASRLDNQIDSTLIDKEFHSLKEKVLAPGIRLENSENQSRQEFSIECFDISNLGDKNIVAGMTVYSDGIINKAKYKKFRIKIQKKQSDFAALSEAITRRLSHPEWGLPDLILLDGGKPQLETIWPIIEKFNQTHSDQKPIRLLSIAKRPDRILTRFGPDIKQIVFPSRSELMRIFVALRDEAHRFSKKYHIKLRDQAFSAQLHD